MELQLCMFPLSTHALGGGASHGMGWGLSAQTDTDRPMDRIMILKTVKVIRLNLSSSS